MVWERNEIMTCGLRRDWVDLVDSNELMSFTLQFIARKTEAALAGGLGVILCIGESLEVCLCSFASINPILPPQVEKFLKHSAD
jgi:hypothetical protein